jgi:hypothetical protein
MNGENNFKKLLEEDESRYAQLYQERGGASIRGTIGLFRLVGDLVHMFLPSMMGILVLAFGGKQSQATNVKPPAGLIRGPEAPPPGKIGPRRLEDYPS